MNKSNSAFSKLSRASTLQSVQLEEPIMSAKQQKEAKLASIIEKAKAHPFKKPTGHELEDKLSPLFLIIETRPNQRTAWSLLTN